MNLDLMEETFRAAPSAGASAGSWWAVVLSKPKHDNGTSDPANIVAQVMADTLSTENPAQPVALELFAGYLKEAIDKMIEEGGSRISIGVDYHPDRLLSVCAERANLMVPMLAWPWKTHMWVTAQSVTVRYGHGADSKIIWGEKI